MEFVKMNVKDYIATVTYHKPPVNSVNLASNAELAETFESIQNRDDVRVVILRSEGKGFMSGSDVTDFKSFSSDDLLTEYEQANVRTGKAIVHCRYPVIGAVQGYALALGLAYAACCDILICSDDAFFGVPEVKVATIGGAGFLNKLAPDCLTRYMAFTGKYIDVHEMKKYGEILRVVPRERLYDECLDVAREIAGNYTRTVQYFKEAMNRNLDYDLIAKFNVECEYTHKMREDPVRMQILKDFENK